MGADVTSARMDVKASTWANGDEHCQEQDRIVTGGLPLGAPTTHTLPRGVQGRGCVATSSRHCSGCASTSPPKNIPREGSPGFLGTVSQTESGT